MVDIKKGFLGYECLGRVIREHPGYEGYFCISDDVILKYWNFPEFDREKIWESSFLSLFPIHLTWPRELAGIGGIPRMV